MASSPGRKSEDDDDLGSLSDDDSQKSEEKNGEEGGNEDESNPDFHGLSPQQIQEYQEIFDLVDLDHGGTIDAEELLELLVKVGLDCTQDYVDEMITEVDENNDGEVSFEEFIAVMSRKVKSKYSIRQLRNAFSSFEDSERKGYVNMKDLEEHLAKHTNFPRADIQDLLYQMEPIEDGYLNYLHYIATMADDE